MKPIANVSTVSVAMLGKDGVLDEDADVRVATPTLPLDTGRYAEGYALSKWAGEVLLREAHDRYQLPVSVFRSDMILPHSQYKGQINIPDMFTRWLMSVVLTGLAPKSFYSGDASRAHYDGLPGNFTAEAVSTLGVNALSGFRTYHVVNPHDDAISQDTFVDWAIEAGVKIERIADYADWAARFETALRSLPERQRNASSLPLIHQTKQPMPASAGAHADATPLPGGCAEVWRRPGQGHPPSRQTLHPQVSRGSQGSRFDLTGQPPDPASVLPARGPRVPFRSDRCHTRGADSRGLRLSHR
jgi:fatty acid CoA ligase FadD9